jgi:hypothetical protein
MRIAICQTITAILDAYFFDIKNRKKLNDLPTDDERKDAVVIIFKFALMWAFGAITNNDDFLKIFNNLFLSKCEGIPKEGKPLD